MARAIKLIDAPIGLFEVDGILVLKTEYSTRHEDGTITPDCYIIESGEYFWGGVDSVEERNNLEVAPVDMPTLTPPNEPLTLEQLREMVGEPVYDYLGQEWYVIQEYYDHELTMTDGTRFFDDDEIDEVDKRFYRRLPEGEA